jgi:hypothetical protein
MDVRVPMGVMFVILGAILVVTGFRTDADQLQQTLGINLNLWWGLLILLFGLVMLLLAAVGRRKAPPGKEGTI